MSDQQPYQPVPSGRPPEIGAMFGQYRIERQIGSGGMGAVYAATDTRLNRQVALKVVLGHHAMSSEFTERFHREAAILGRLDSPHVISVFDHGQEGGWPYIVAQYVGGGDLAQLLHARGALPRPVAVSIVEQVADALVSAHAVGIVHRDVKPANVLLRDDRTDRPHVYLADFGVALTEATGLTTPGSVAGTWNYLSPERTRGDQGTVSSDVYAVGCLLYEALTGTPPFAGSDVEVAVQHLQGAVPQLDGNDEFTRNANHVLARCLAKEPGERYPDATALRDDLRHLHASVDPLQGAVVPSGGSGRGRTLALVGGAVLAAALVVTTVVVVLNDGDGDPGGGDPTPAAADTTAGDVDGDGFGDVVLTTFGESVAVLSDGTTLGGGAPEQLPLLSRPSLLGDFSADGSLRYADLEGDSPNISVNLPDGDDPGSKSLLRILSGSIVQSPDAAAADVDGDGLDDIVIRMSARDESALFVALNLGDGTFAATSNWYAEPLAEGRLVPGDFDGDGDDDIVLAANGDGVSQPTAVTMLLSTGEAFEAGTTTQFTDRGISQALGGDVTGDGVPDVVLPDGSDTTVLSYVDGKFTSPESWMTNSDIFVDDAALSDLDGDGDTDLLTLVDDDLKVYLAEDGAFVVGGGWTAGVTVPKDSYLTKDSVDNASG